MVHYLAAAVLAASSFAVTPEKATWQADYGQALTATKNDQRPLLVVLDSQADPKTAVESKLLAPEGEKAQVLKAYHVCRVDVASDYGKKVAQAFGAKQFPYTAIIDKTGSKVLFQKPGQMAAQDFHATLAKFQKGVSVKTQTVGYRGNTILNAQSRPASSPGFCPACQRRAMGLQ
jgi:hypothetical protein